MKRLQNCIINLNSAQVLQSHFLCQDTFFIPLFYPFILLFFQLSRLEILNTLLDYLSKLIDHEILIKKLI